jgi:hypothetical protein
MGIEHDSASQWIETLMQQILNILHNAYIRFDESDKLQDALVILQTGKKLPKKLAQDIDFIIEKYS